MSRNNTGNPIGSKAFPDFEDNVKNLDEAVNTADPQWVDRFGRFRLPLMEQERRFIASQDSREDQFQSAQSSREAVFSGFLQASGYQDLGEYAPGIEITAHNQYVTFGGQPYLLKPSIPVPYTTSGEWTGDDFKLIGDGSIRQDLANPDMGAAMVARGVVTLKNIKELGSINQAGLRPDSSYEVCSFIFENDTGGGLFRWEASKSKTAHNGGTVIDPDRVTAWDGTLSDLETLFTPASAGTGCFVRVHSIPYASPEIHAAWFGAYDSAVDSARSIRQAITTAKQDYPNYGDGRFTGRVKVVLSSCSADSLSSYQTIFVPPEVDIWMGVPLKYYGEPHTPCIVHGEPGARIWKGESKYHTIRDRDTHSWWLDPRPVYTEEDVGVVIINAMICDLYVSAVYSEVGCKMVGDSGGFSYNKVYMGYIHSNKIGQWLHSEVGGWVNENSFYGGNWNRSPSSIDNAACQAVRSTKDGESGGNNNNTWYTPSFESMGHGASGVVPIIDAVRATNSRWLNVRDESSNSTIFIKEGPLSRANSVTLGYSPTYGVLSRFETDALVRTTQRTYGAACMIRDGMQTVLFDSGRLSLNSVVVGSRVAVKGGVAVSALGSSVDPKASVYSATNMEITAEGITGAARAVSTHLKLNGCDQLIIKCSGTSVPYIVCYDSGFNQIADLEPNKHITHEILGRAYSPGELLGGCYSASQSEDLEYFIGVHNPEVKYLGIFMSITRDNPPLDRFVILTNAQNQQAVAFQPVASINANCFQAQVPPSGGVSRRGDVVYNETPSIGGYQGWVCVEAGSPGVWKGFGLIED